MDTVIKIQYSKKQLRYSLIFGVLWLIFFMLYMLFWNESYFAYGYLVIGILFLGTYFYKKTVHYLTIKNGILTKNSVLPKHVQLNQVNEVRYFAGDYKLITDTSEMTINTMLIAKKSLEDLKRILDTLKQKS